MRIESWQWILFFSLVWIWPAFLVAKAAAKKQRSYGGFLIVSLIIGWVIPLLVVLVMKQEPQVSSRKCPFCAEPIQPEAKVCKHCNRDLDPQTA